MAESSSHIPSSPPIIPKEEPITHDRPEIPNPFSPADQVDLNFDDMLLTTNNKVALVYPDHANKETFLCVSDFISKRYLRKAFISAPTQYVQYLAEFWPWFAEIGYKGEIRVKGTLKKSCLPPRWRLLMEDLIHKLNKKSRERIIAYPRFISLLIEYMAPEYHNESLTINPTRVFSVHDLALKPNQLEGPPFTKHMLVIYNTYVPDIPKAPNTSSQAEKKKKKICPARPWTVTQANLQHPHLWMLKCIKRTSKQLGAPTSLGATSEEGAHPQLSSGMSAFTNIESVFSASFSFHSESASGHDASADFTAKIDLRNTAPNDSMPPQHDTTKSMGDGSQIAHTKSGTKQDQRSAFFDDDEEDEPIIALAESSEEKVDNMKTLMLNLKALQFLFLLLNQFNSIPVELKELPIKITKLHREVHELRKSIQEFEIELPGAFNEIPQKLETFSSTVSSLATQTLEALSGLLAKVTDTLNRFANILHTHSESVPSASKSTASHAEGEKNTNPAKDAETSNLVDFMGIDVVEEYHQKKLLYNKYYDKMLKRKKSPKITNCEVLTRKCPIILKIFREDGYEEVITNLKTRMDYLTQTEKELKIDFNKPLKDQDPLKETRKGKELMTSVTHPSQQRNSSHQFSNKEEIT
ncbi:hypothetical protein Tco_0312449 [Tanacetum coccineum]